MDEETGVQASNRIGATTGDGTHEDEAVVCKQAAFNML